MGRREKFQITLLTFSCFFMFAGCSSWTPKSKPGPRTVWNPTTWFNKEYQQPASLATIWKADQIQQPGHPAQRGFGASVYFYNERSQAIPVEGDLVIHGYLTTPSSRKQPHEEPDQKFTFSTEQLASQFAPSDMGASYNIWVPWDVAGGFREEVTLIATFKSKKGGVVQGSPTRLFLPGSSRSPENDPRGIPESVQQVSYQQRSIPTYDVGPAPEKTTTRITTIEIPSESKLSRPSEGISVGGGDSGRGQSLDVGVSVGGSPARGLGNPSSNYQLQALTPPIK